MRISDWSSDVCSSDLAPQAVPPHPRPSPGSDGAARPRRDRCGQGRRRQGKGAGEDGSRSAGRGGCGRRCERQGVGEDGDRKSVGQGKSVSVRVDLGGRRFITKKKTNKTTK